jgi:hypothetical protein
MRRTIVCLLGLLMLPVFGQSAAADVSGGAEIMRSAYASWWRQSGNTGAYYFIDVYGWASSNPNRPAGQRAYLAKLSCEVNSKDKPRKCDFRHMEIERLKIKSFSFDPALGSAHAVLRRGHSKANISWTGKGQYSEPFIWQGISEYMFGPSFAGAGANAMLAEGRRASTEGRVFDLGLTRKNRAGGGLADYAIAGAYACTENFFC